MRARSAVISGLALSVFAAVVPLPAQSVPPGTQPVPRRQLELAAQALAKIAKKPRATCGLTVIPADPNVDSKLIQPAPHQGTKPTMRQIAPGACR
jgi:hypothetical protein